MTGSSAGAVRAFEETAIASELSGARISKSSASMSKAIEKSATTSGVSTSSLSESMFAMVPIQGKVAVAVGVTAIAIGTAATVMADKYDGATRAMASNAGISIAAARATGDAFLTTAGETTFSAQSMMTAFSPVAGQLGAVNGGALSAKQSLEFMNASMALAEATGGDLTATTGTLAGVLQAFQMPVSAAAGATDTLYNASKTVGMPVADFAAGVEKLHTKMGPVGGDLSQLSTLMTDLAEHGVTGTRGLAAVSAAVTTLLSPTKAGSDAIKQMGLNLYTSSGQFVGMQSVITQLSPKLKGMSDEQRMTIENAVLGKGAFEKLDTTIMAGTPGWDTAAAAVGKHGTASAAAAANTATLSGSMDKLRGAAVDIGIQIGGRLTPIVGDFMNGLSMAAVVVAKNLPGALNVLGNVFGVVFRVIGVLIDAWKIEFTVIGAVAGAVFGGIGTVIHVLVVAFQAVEGAASSVGSKIGSVFGGIGGAVKGGINAVIGAVNSFINAVDKMQIHIPSFSAGPVSSPSFDWNGPGIHTIPTLDSGGVVNRPTLALLAANSRPEAVIPLDRAGGVGGGGVQITQHFTLTGSDEQLLAKVKALVDHNNQQLARAVGARAA